LGVSWGMETLPAAKSDTASQLVDAHGLLEALFDPACRPTVRWVRQMQAQRRIPYLKIGRLVRFDLVQVRHALAETSTIHVRE